MLETDHLLSPTNPSRRVPGELALIEDIRRRVGSTRPVSAGLRVGIGDDCAVLRPRAGHEICVTTDFSLEGVHFRRDWHPPESAGHRCLARGLSDLAAMGAEPLAVFLSLALPTRLPARWVERFLDGFLALAAHHRVPLAGGDTAESPGVSRSDSGLVFADIVAVGQVLLGQPILRSGARAGDRIYITGALGGAKAELETLARHPGRFRRLTQAVASHPQLYPEPRVAAGLRLRKLAHAMIDVSDGLSTDLIHVCRESHLDAVIEEWALPIHTLAAANPERLALALHGGEDYELLFTASPKACIPRRVAGVPIHCIGIMREHRAGQPRIVLKRNDGRNIAVESGGWEHFGG